MILFEDVSFPESVSICPYNSAEWAELSLNHNANQVHIRYHCGTTQTVVGNDNPVFHQSEQCALDELRILRDLDVPGLTRELHAANDQISLLHSEVASGHDAIAGLEAEIATLKEGIANDAVRGIQIITPN